jgi:transposase-like protein
VQGLKKELYHCLHLYDFPGEMWGKIRTIKILERAFGEVRRRADPLGSFPLPQAPTVSSMELPIS